MEIDTLKFKNKIFIEGYGINKFKISGNVYKSPILILKNKVIEKKNLKLNSLKKDFLLKQNTTTGFFELSQTLYSRNIESVEFFGSSLSFDQGTLAICAKNADSRSNTVFDSNNNVPQTTFDNNFTLFSRTYVDTGVVYLYEDIDGTLVYGQTLTYVNDDSSQAVANSTAINSVQDFGIHLYANNNHVYVGLPKQTVAQGTNGAVPSRQSPQHG